MKSHSNSRPSRRRAATLPVISVHRLTFSPFRWKRGRRTRGTVRRSRTTDHGLRHKNCDSRFTSRRSRVPGHQSRFPKTTYEPRGRSHLNDYFWLVTRFLIYSSAIRIVRNSQKTNSRPISNLQCFGVSGPPFAVRELPTPTYQSLRREPRTTDHYSPMTSHSVCACAEPLRN